MKDDDQIKEKLIRELGELRIAHDKLETTLAVRTSELTRANAALKNEVMEHVHAENELRRSSESLRVAQEMSLDAFTILSPVRNENGSIVDFRWEFANAEAGRLLKYAPGDLVGRRLLDVLPGNRAYSDLFDRYVQVCETGVPHDYELRYESEGINGWFRNMTVKLGDSIAVSFSDITGRKQAESALRESEERFKDLAESMTQMVWISDGRENSVYHNPRFAEYTGLEKSTAAERNRLVHPDDLRSMWNDWQVCLRKGEVFLSSFRLRGKDGNYRWFLGRTVLKRDADGNLLLIYATATDIDDLVRTREALNENLAILDKAENIGLTGSWKRELASNRVTWSPGLYRIFGLPEGEEATSAKQETLIHPEDRDSLMGKLEEMTRKGTPLATEYRIIRPDGTIRTLFCKGEATFDEEGKPIFINGVTQDITERKKLEEELINARKLESIGTLAGGLAHDYNNILTSALGNLELAMMRLEKSDPAYAPLSEARKAAMDAAELTRKFITFARGGYLAMKSLDTGKILTRSVLLALGGSNTKAEWKITDDLAGIDADEDQLNQVIQNIVMNAREAMPHGGILSIDARNVAFQPDNPYFLSPGPYVRLSFRDEGVGIPAQNLMRIFDPYFTTKDMGAVKGMGLGLPICFSILKRHGGHISVDSTAGLGTTVSIFLPARRIPMDPHIAR